MNKKNKIKGSIIAKLTAWVLCVACAVAAIAFLALTVVGASAGWFHMSYEEALSEEFQQVNAQYSRIAHANMQNNVSQRELTESGFYFGILQSDGLSKETLRDVESYLSTNFTAEQLAAADEGSLYLYQIQGNRGVSYGCVSEWEDLTELESSAGEPEEVTVYQSQYADAVCYDIVKGILYYRSMGCYYPVQWVELYYQGAEYNYSYNFEREQYELNYYAYSAYDNDDRTDETSASGNTTVAEERKNNITEILTGSKTGGFVDFSRLNGTEFNWQRADFLLDNVRSIMGDELTEINSNSIAASYFISEPDYYLDKNYTLHVAETAQTQTESYWIVSILPDASSLLVEGSKYYFPAMLAGTFYQYDGAVCALMVICTIMTLVSFIFLACAAGCRRGREDIVLTWFDRLPLEVFSCAVLFAAGMSACLMIAPTEYDSIMGVVELFLPLVLTGAVGVCAFIIWWLLDLCVRVKAGKWWKNTLCYRLFFGIKTLLLWLKNGIGSFLGGIFRFRWAGATLLLKLILEIVALMICGTDSALIVFWLAENIVVCVLVSRVARQLDRLQTAAEKMAEGDTDYQVNTEGMIFDCRQHGENLNKIGEGVSKAVEERMKSERFKTELITNVSHDIKTPLTSIISYVDLLEKEELNNEKAREYLEVLERQSAKLKKLTEDLVEASKAATGNLAVHGELLEAGVFLTQTVGEFEERLSSLGLELIVKKPDKPIYIYADGRHLWRVADNLMNNICKYAQPSSRVYVSLEQESDTAVIIFRNISRYELNADADELTERFARGDKSRSTEGHGLGLSIAKSLMDLMGAQMQLVVDGDLFKVTLAFKVQEERGLDSL